MMLHEVWDVKDKCVVEQPDFETNGERFTKMNRSAQQIHMVRYENAVNALPAPARARFLRAMATIDVIVAVIQYGIKNQLTSP